jgi:hypothetical protein
MPEIYLRMPVLITQDMIGFAIRDIIRLVKNVMRLNHLRTPALIT